MRLICLSLLRPLGLMSLLALLPACVTEKLITLNARPADATLKVDDQERGKPPLAEKFVFNNERETHRVTASRPGYREQTVTISRDYPKEDLLIDLKPLSKHLTFAIVPMPGILSINGVPVSGEPISQYTKELEFTLDAKNQWTTYKITVQRAGFEPLSKLISYADKENNYILQLAPMKKDLVITTTPPGAKVYYDDELVGTSPVKLADKTFEVEGQGSRFITHKIRIAKPGYDPVEQTISWDDGKTDYSLLLKPKTKTVTIVTDPPGGLVKIDDKPLPRNAQGVTTATLSFPPANDEGELSTISAQVNKKTADSEWETQTLVIGWDNGKTDYSVRLKEIKTVPVELLGVQPRRGDAWQMVWQRQMTLAMKDTTEGPKKESPVQLKRFSRSEQLDSMSVSPDGKQLLFTVLLPGGDNDDLRSQLRIIRTDGTGGEQYLSDGKSLELMASYTPDGSQIVFCSNRAGRVLSIWSMSALGLPGMTQLTSGETHDLWPSVDSDPKPRLYYELLADKRPDPRLYMTQLGTTIRTDLTSFGGTQPRVSPKADAIVFTAVNPKTGKRDIYRMSDRGTEVVNITNTPDVDEADAAWSSDGGKIAFSSDLAVNEQRQHYRSLWVMDLAGGGQPRQVTTNGSWDDCPSWDPSGQYLYFRSNRGGEWAIWKIGVK